MLVVLGGFVWDTVLGSWPSRMADSNAGLKWLLMRFAHFVTAMYFISMRASPLGLFRGRAFL